MTENATFAHLTVCTDFSPGAQAAVERAAQLAAVHGATLCLLQAFDASVMRGLGTASPAGVPDSHPEPLALESRTAGLHQRLAATAQQLAQRTGLKVESALAIGTALAVIGAHVQAHAPSLLVLGSRFDPATAGLGGTALKLLRAPACPVLVVRNAATHRYRQVLSAVDLRDGSVRAAVAALALFPEARHHLLYAVAPALDTSLEDGGLEADQVQRLQESMHQNAERELKLLAQGLSKKTRHPVSAEIASDVPARALLVGAASLQADCVVVGHHDSATVGQTELGSMALHVLQFVPSDILVVP